MLPTPGETRSLLVVLGVDKVDASGSFSGDVDGVMLEQSPRVFDDGFE